MSQHATRNAPAARKEGFVYDMDFQTARRSATKLQFQSQHLPPVNPPQEQLELYNFQNMDDNRDDEELTANQMGKKKSWTNEEDGLLVELIERFGPQKWTFIAQHLNGRIGKQCRERWHNHLNPSIKKDQWEDKEEWLLYLSHRLLGNRWADISKYIVGRTDNSIKNHWNSSMKKKMPEYYQKYKCAKRNPSLLSRLSPLEKQLFQGLMKVEGNVLDSHGESNTKERRRGFQPTHIPRPQPSTLLSPSHTTEPICQSFQFSVTPIQNACKSQQQAPVTERSDLLQVPQIRKKKVRISNPDRTIKKYTERFDFTITPKKDLSRLHFVYSPHPSQFPNNNTSQKPSFLQMTSNPYRQFNSPSVLMNLSSPSKGDNRGFSSIILFRADNSEDDQA